MKATNPKTLQAKQQVIDEIKSMITSSKSFALIDYKGLTVLKDTELRVNFRNAKVEYRVLKNTMVRIALNDLGYKEFDNALNGPTAVAFAHDDEMAPFKIASECISKNNKMSMKCGMFEHKFVDDKTCTALSNIPSRSQLLSMLCSVLQAPIRGLACAIKAVAESKN